MHLSVSCALTAYSIISKLIQGANRRMLLEENSTVFYELMFTCLCSLSWLVIQLHDVFTKLQEALCGHCECLLLGQTHIANTLKHRSFQPAKECSWTHFSASDCLWLAGLDFSTMLTSHNWVSEPIDHGTLQHAIFISPCHFNHLVLGVNMK